MGLTFFVFIFKKSKCEQRKTTMMNNKENIIIFCQMWNKEF
jgi:hypothetical protein